MTRRPRTPKPSSPTKKDAPATRPPESSASSESSRTITLSAEAIGVLEEMARESGMSKSGVVEALLQRARKNVPTPAAPAPPSPPLPASPAADPASAPGPRKKTWEEAIREFREMRERSRK